MRIQPAPAPPALARALAPAVADPAQRAVALEAAAPHPVRSTIPTGGLLGAQPAEPAADKAVAAARNFALGQMGLAPTTLRVLPGFAAAAADDIAMRHALAAFEKGLEAELGPTVWRSVTLVIGAPQALRTLADGEAPAAERGLAAAKLLNGIGKVVEQHWPALAPYRQALSLAITGAEAGKVALLFLDTAREVPTPKA